MIESLVDFVYSDENVARLAWVPRKSLLQTNNECFQSLGCNEITCP